MSIKSFEWSLQLESSANYVHAGESNAGDANGVAVGADNPASINAEEPGGEQSWGRLRRAVSVLRCRKSNRDQ